MNERPSLEIPVHRLLPSGQTTDHPFNGEQCIRIGVSFAAAVPQPDGRMLLPNITWMYALIDTGAQWNCLDSALLEANKSPSLGTAINNGVVGSSLVTNHKVQLLVEGKAANAIHVTGAVGLNLIGRTVPWRMILGRKFLQLTRFRYDGSNGITHMEFFPNDAAL